MGNAKDVATGSGEGTAEESVGCPTVAGRDGDAVGEDVATAVEVARLSETRSAA
ncbi:hypothetical protein [Sphaerimonospora thailandensis]|uniref:Uncharacterized protein n=1 Tax=Sphaerimonospora thailandensis TaxID=795644 RepID=A0A8J3W0T4_9ACTN|nr:hypothetical protein [Sphaerimonospora thailandensis]GIH71101.1 hypothetical protein Mth01_33540 [Sphaerimonospora thailandensis]